MASNRILYRATKAYHLPVYSVYPFCKGRVMSFSTVASRVGKIYMMLTFAAFIFKIGGNIHWKTSWNLKCLIINAEVLLEKLKIYNASSPDSHNNAIFYLGTPRDL
jgi:hypothetical protein